MAPKELHSSLSFLLRACLTHGFIPLCLLLSTVIPITKDKLGDHTISSNYRGIALCAMVMKIFEYVLLCNHSSALCSSDFQYAYKKHFSTTQCTWVANEVINHYKSNDSDVYACFLDCSKAFDKVRYDVLFPKLMD